MPVEDGDLAESLAQEILDHEPRDLLQHPAGQADRTGKVPAAAAARPGVSPVEHGGRHDQPAPGGRLGGDVLRDERVSAQRQMRAVLFDRADGQHDGRPGVDLGPDLRPSHLFQAKWLRLPCHDRPSQSVPAGGAAIDDESGAGHEGRGIAGQEKRCLGDLLRPPGALQEERTDLRLFQGNRVAGLVPGP